MKGIGIWSSGMDSSFNNIPAPKHLPELRALLPAALPFAVEIGIVFGFGPPPSWRLGSCWETFSEQIRVGSEYPQLIFFGF